MKSLIYLTVFAVLVLIASREVIADDVDFNRDVRPILSDKCFACHGPDEEKRESELRLDTFAGATADLGDYAAVVPGDVNSSVLIHRIDDDDDPMPPEDSNLTLSDSEKAILRAWIASGAKFVKHWAFAPPVRPDVPQAEAGSNPIDAFIPADPRIAPQPP